MIRFALLLLLASGVGCTSDAPQADAQPPEASGDAELWMARGVFYGTRFEGQTANIDHENIPGLMDAMRMDFLLASPEAVDGLEAGDKVSFRLDYIDNRIVASDFEVLPDTTRLSLASGATPADSTAE